jgi:glycosyltransferase involved in cell wall biosynthesis
MAGAEPVFAPGFNTWVQWDIPLLNGYEYRSLRNWSHRGKRGFWSRVNPSILLDFLRHRYDFVLIQGHNTASAWIALLAAKITSTKILFRGEAILQKRRRSWKARLKPWILYRLFWSYDAILYSCSGNKEYFQFYGVPEEKLFPIPCAVDNNFFQRERVKYNQRRSEIKTELGIPDDWFTVLFVARFTGKKRPLDVLRVAQQLTDSRVAFVLVGDGPEMPRLRRFVAENRIQNVVFVGFVNQSEISKYYSIGDLALVISEYDPSPKVMNEVMNFAVPVICSETVGTAYDLVKEGINGYIVKVGDIETIARHIEHLVENRELAEEMGRKSLQIVSEWNFERGVEGILNAMDFVSGRG